MMAKVTKAIVDKDLRDRIFKDAIYADNDEVEWHKINDRQYGCILTDLNGETRYIRLGAIVAELREDMTAEELMQSEIDAYTAKQDARAEKAQKKAEKIAKDKARREAEAEAKTEGE
jgi:DNA-directed RNA polymerase delta subunit